MSSENVCKSNCLEVLIHFDKDTKINLFLRLPFTEMRKFVVSCALNFKKDVSLYVGFSNG